MKVKSTNIQHGGYYITYLLKCDVMNVILNAVKQIQGLKGITIQDVLPAWDCPKLQELRKNGKMPGVMLSILNGYTVNDFEEFMKNN